MLKDLLFFAICCTPLLIADPIPLFHPPEDWECALPKNHSPSVRVGFVGKGSFDFRPSMNLAIEEIDVSAAKYLKAVKEIHLADPETRWRDLGEFFTSAGKGRLTEITFRIPIGEVKMLQMILVKEKKAYVLTGAAIKDEYLPLYGLFTKVFRSFSLPNTLLQPVAIEKAEQIEALFSTALDSLAQPMAEFRADLWKRLQHLVFQETPELGNYWQLLILSEGYKKIYSQQINSEQKRHP